MAIRRVSPNHEKAAVLAFILFLLCPLVSAQKFLKLPSIEVFGGYSHLRFESVPLGFSDQLNLDGWNAAISLPDLYQGFGIAADVSGHYTQEMKEYNFLIGPQYAFRWKGIRLYGHGLFGKARDRLRLTGSSQIEPSSLARAFAFGGGFDFPVGEKFSVRPIQADYLITSAFSGTQHDIRLSSGLVFRFGKR
jgi:hypothetical protein